MEQDPVESPFSVFSGMFSGETKEDRMSNSDSVDEDVACKVPIAPSSMPLVESSSAAAPSGGFDSLAQHTEPDTAASVNALVLAEQQLSEQQLSAESNAPVALSDSQLQIATAAGYAPFGDGGFHVFASGQAKTEIVSRPAPETAKSRAIKEMTQLRRERLAKDSEKRMKAKAELLKRMRSQAEKSDEMSVASDASESSDDVFARLPQSLIDEQTRKEGAAVGVEIEEITE